MTLGTFFPLLSMIVISSPSTSVSLLFPPEGNDYPLYDFPSVQYVPHNTLVEYQDPRQSTEEDLQDEEEEEETDEDLIGDKMEVATRSTYFPISSSSKAAASSPSSTSPRSYPYPPPPPPPPPPQASSSSSFPDTIPCTTEDIAGMLNTDDLDKMIKVVAKIEGKSTKELLMKLALKHGLHLKGGHRVVGSPINTPPPDSLRSLQLLDASPPSSSQRPLVHLRRPPKGIPPPSVSRVRPHVVEDTQIFDPVAIEVPAIAPRAIAGPMRSQALVVVEDRNREEVARLAVQLGPRMALLDVLKEAKMVFALDNGPYRHNPFIIRARKLEIERCLGLQSIGRVSASPNSALVISVTRTRPLPEVVWQSPCLPRVSDLLVRPGDVIVLAPR